MPPATEGSSCICKICICGRHNCPIHGCNLFTKSSDLMPTTTEYKDEYPRRGLEKRENYAPVYKPRIGGKPMENVTSYRSAFREPKVPTKIVRPKQDYLPPSEPMEKNTSYQLEYMPKEVAKLRSCRPPHRPGQRAPFKGTTHYQTDFVPYGDDWKTVKRTPFAPKQTLMPYGGEFEGTSTHRDDFSRKQCDRPRPFRPSSRPMESGEFKGQSTYLTDYPRKNVSRPKRIEVKHSKIGDGTFYGDTTTGTDYIAHKGIHRRNNCAPDRAYSPPTCALEGETTTKSTYTGHPICKPDFPDWAKNRHRYEAPDQEMEKSTSYKDDYDPKEVSRREPIKPNNTRLGDRGKLDDNTTYNRDYVPHKGAQVRKPFIDPRPFVQSEDPLDESTNYKDAYTAKTQQKRQPFRPKHLDMSQSGPMEKDSIYRTEFKGKQMEICPAGVLIAKGGVQAQPGDPVWKYRKVNVHNQHHFFNKRGSYPDIKLPDPNMKPVASQQQPIAITA